MTTARGNLPAGVPMDRDVHAVEDDLGAMEALPGPLRAVLWEGIASCSAKEVLDLLRLGARERDLLRFVAEFQDHDAGAPVLRSYGERYQHLLGART